VLDAPELKDDSHLNILDWSAQNMISVALGKSVYLYNASTTEVVKLCDVSGGSNFVTSVAWNEQVSHISFSLF
jgi:WD40 repeat protein